MSEYIVKCSDFGHDLPPEVYQDNLRGWIEAETFGTPVTRCRDCRFGDPYPPDEFFRDCRMMRHKIVPVDCFCALGKPKEAS